MDHLKMNRLNFQDILFADNLDKDILIVNSIFEKSGVIEIHKVDLHFIPDPAENTKILENKIEDLKEFLKAHKKLNKVSSKVRILKKY